MAYEQWHGQKDKTHNIGQIEYAGDGTNFFPILGSTAGITTSVRPIMAQREPFIFRPGATALSGGMVIAGSVTGCTTVTTAASATTVWSPAITYSPLRGGKIDGLSTGGVISGQITVGMLGGAAATTDAKVTARIVNAASTAYVVCLTLTAGTSIGGTTEVFQTYDIPHLKTTTDFNAVPFDFFVGFQSSKAAASCSVIGRVTSASLIQGEFEPGT